MNQLSPEKTSGPLVDLQPTEAADSLLRCFDADITDHKMKRWIMDAKPISGFYVREDGQLGEILNGKVTGAIIVDDIDVTDEDQIVTIEEPSKPPTKNERKAL